MIPANIEQIANALGKIFPVNLFLVSEKGEIQWVNEQMLKTIESKLSAIQGKHVSVFGNKEWLNTKKVVESKKGEILYENFQSKNFISIKVPHTENHFRGVIGLSIDVTGLKKAEIAKREFLMNMAHDLRTPLMGIIGISNIQAVEGTEAQDRQYGQWIQEAGDQLLELLNSVIEVSAAENPVNLIKSEKVDLAQLAEELGALIQISIINKGLSFQIKHDTLPMIVSDHIKLKRILLNLLSNAVKFTQQGEITLEIKWLVKRSDRAHIEIHITDTGIGIPEDKLEKIFERFYRIRPSYQAKYPGNGIGLYLVKQALEQLGGSINVSSQEGKGSCFTLTFDFPLAEVPTSFKSLESYYEPDFKSNESQGLVLVADNATLILHIVKKVLLRLDYQVLTASTGEAALQMLQTQSFVWALLDIDLPDLEGAEVAIRHRQWEKEHRKPRLPLFAFSANISEEIRKNCEKADMDYVFNKPFTTKEAYVIKLFMEDKD